MAYKGPDHQTQISLSDHSSPPATSQATFQPHPPSDDSSKTVPSACHPLPPNFAWLTLQLKCSLISPLDLTSCVVFFCYVPAAPALPAFQNLLPGWCLPGTHLYPSACLGARPGSNQVCLAPLHCLTSTRHGAWHMPHHISITSVLAGLNRTSGQEEKGHPTQESRFAKTRELERVLSVSEMGSSPVWPNLGEEPAQSWS